MKTDDVICKLNILFLAECDISRVDMQQGHSPVSRKYPRQKKRTLNQGLNISVHNAARTL